MSARRKFFVAFHRIVVWRSIRGHKRAGDLIYRWLCPRPIGDYYTARDCIRAGYCGCDNHPNAFAEPPKARPHAALENENISRLTPSNAVQRGVEISRA